MHTINIYFERLKNIKIIMNNLEVQLKQKFDFVINLKCFI
jgi:hypothetical protein